MRMIRNPIDLISQSTLMELLRPFLKSIAVGALVLVAFRAGSAGSQTAALPHPDGCGSFATAGHTSRTCGGLRGSGCADEKEHGRMAEKIPAHRQASQYGRAHRDRQARQSRARLQNRGHCLRSASHTGTRPRAARKTGGHHRRAPHQQLLAEYRHSRGRSRHAIS